MAFPTLCVILTAQNMWHIKGFEFSVVYIYTSIVNVEGCRGSTAKESQKLGVGMCRQDIGDTSNPIPTSFLMFKSFCGLCCEITWNINVQ